VSENGPAVVTKSAEKPVETVAETAVEEQPLALQVELQPSKLRVLRPSPAAASDAKSKTRLLGAYGLFLLIVGLPMAIAGIYLLAIASPRYISSASFIVREASQTRPDALASIVQKSGSAIASEETYAVGAYLTSRDIVEELKKNNGLLDILHRPGADFVNRFPTFWLPNIDEFLYRRFKRMVTVEVDSTTNIISVEVNAFDPKDAQTLLRAMLGYAEALVNRLNARAYEDEVAAAQSFMKEEQARVDAAESALQAFRNTNGVIDPNAESESKLKVIGGLSTQLALLETQISQQLAQTPNAPALATLRQQAESTRAEINKRRLEIAGSTVSDATRLEAYDQLRLRRDLAAKSYATAVSDVDSARRELRQQHLFVQLITQPSFSSDYAEYPRVMLDLLMTLGASLLLFQTIRKLIDVAKAHAP
jgi:capsular polysaccharide transport system permease protein